MSRARTKNLNVVAACIFNAKQNALQHDASEFLMRLLRLRELNLFNLLKFTLSKSKTCLECQNTEVIFTDTYNDVKFPPGTSDIQTLLNKHFKDQYFLEDGLPDYTPDGRFTTQKII